MPLLQTGDVEINYTVHGEGDWLVLIAGYASGTWQSWGDQLNQLARRYRVLALDNRGIGDSSAPDCPYTTRMMAHDVIALMDHVGVERAHVLGKSLGGAIAQWVALERPAQVRSLAMISTFAQPCNPDMINWWRATASSAGFEALFPGLLTYFFTAEYYTANPAAVARAKEALARTKRSLTGFLRTGDAVITHDTWERLGEIACPAYVVCGAEDIITPARHSEQIAARIPYATANIVPRTMHGVTTEKPEVFEEIVGFFARN